MAEPEYYFSGSPSGLTFEPEEQSSGFTYEIENKQPPRQTPTYGDLTRTTGTYFDVAAQEADRFSRFRPEIQERVRKEQEFRSKIADMAKKNEEAQRARFEEQQVRNVLVYFEQLNAENLPGETRIREMNRAVVGLPPQIATKLAPNIQAFKELNTSEKKPEAPSSSHTWILNYKPEIDEETFAPTEESKALFTQYLSMNAPEELKKLGDNPDYKKLSTLAKTTALTNINRVPQSAEPAEQKSTQDLYDGE